MPSVSQGQDHGNHWIQRRRVAGIVLLVAGVALVLVTTLVAVTLLVLQTGWGSERLRRQVVARVNRQIQGQLEIGRLSFGGNKLVVWTATLRDPEGQAVAEVARAEVDFSVVRLLRKEVRLTAVAIETPRLGLVSDARGLNLSRATAPRNPGPPPPPAPKTSDEGWVVRIDGFDLTDGDVRVATGEPGTREAKAHLAHLHSHLAARYATGNGSLDLTFRLDGQSALAPVGPLRLSADAAMNGDRTRVAIDGDLLGGKIQARANVDRQHVAAADLLVAVAIPPLILAGYDWGPIRIDGQARPGTIPTLGVLVAIPGVKLTGTGGPGGQDRFTFAGTLALADLGLAAKAAQALTGAGMSPLGGKGRIDFAIGGPMAGAPASWDARTTGLLERLRFGETVVSGLSIKGQVARLSRRPEQADLGIAIASVTAGDTQLRGIALDAKIRAQTLSAELKIDGPEPVSLTVAGQIDNDQHGLAIERLALAYPAARWSSQEIARLRFIDDSLSLANLRLISQGQVLAIDGEKTGERIDGHVTVERLRLGLLPAFIIAPSLHLGGTLDVDVNAHGQLANPTVGARARLEHGRYQGFSQIDAQVTATLAEHQVDGTASVDAPFAGLEAAFKLPVGPLPLAPGAPLDLRIDVRRIDLAEAVRAAKMAAPTGGRASLNLRVTGSAASPVVDLTASGRELTMSRPAGASKAPETIDVGHARVHLTYAERAAHAEVDFGSSRGGTLRVDAGAQLDLCYPRVTRGLVVAKMPIHGKIVARNFDVAWLSRFSDRLDAVGGQLSADARLAGTVGDPQMVGDVHWKNGNVVANARPVRAAASKR
jgi:autotransporter translocation and assembly factor TamB